MNDAAEGYVRLALAIGTHDPDSVDAYYGPAEWKAEVEAERPALGAIRDAAERLRDRVRSDSGPAGSDRRRLLLARQLEALMARADVLNGVSMSFDEESFALYDAVAPERDEEHFRELRSRLDAELPGSGPLPERLEAFRAGFVVPPERLDAVFRRAVLEAREITRRRLVLPDVEDFTVEFVTGKTWSGYNWYQGNFRSLIQVNVDLPVGIDRAIDLACHEGYPGHHVHNVLREKNLVCDRGWIEYQVYPLFCPEALIAEGSANFGIEVAFPGAERAAFEKAVLYPLAGLDPERAEEHERIRLLAERLSAAGNEAARGLVDGGIGPEAAADWLTEHALMPPARARQRVRFIEQYRSYVINYNLGKDLVRGWVEAHGGTVDRPERRWQVFESLLTAPILPSELAAAG